MKNFKFLLMAFLAISVSLASCSDDDDDDTDNGTTNTDDNPYTGACKPVSAVETDADGTETTSTLTWSGDNLSKMDMGTQTMSFEYNSDGTVSKATMTEGSQSQSMTYTYDSQKRVTAIATGDGAMTYTYTDNGFMEIAGDTTYCETDANGRITKKANAATDPTDYTTYTYDSKGNMTQMVSYSSGSEVYKMERTYVSGKASFESVMPSFMPTEPPAPAELVATEARTQSGSTENESFTYEYNSSGQVTKQTSSDGSVMVMTYSCD